MWGGISKEVSKWTEEIENVSTKGNNVLCTTSSGRVRCCALRYLMAKWMVRNVSLCVAFQYCANSFQMLHANTNHSHHIATALDSKVIPFVFQAPSTNSSGGRVRLSRTMVFTFRWTIGLMISDSIQPVTGFNPRALGPSKDSKIFMYIFALRV